MFICCRERQKSGSDHPLAGGFRIDALHSRANLQAARRAKSDFDTVALGSMLRELVKLASGEECGT